MSKPEDIPQDVWDAASELLYAVEAMPSDGNITVIARAILTAKAEERESIAAFCEVQSPRVVGQFFAAAIRKRGEG